MGVDDGKGHNEEPVEQVVRVDEAETPPEDVSQLVDADADQNLDAMSVEERLEKVKVFKKQGNDEFGLGNYNESIAAYTEGLRICPTSDAEFRSVLFANRSAARIKLDLKEEAVEDCTQAIEHNPNYVRALLRRAKLYEELDKLDEAFADYKNVLELDPSNRDAHLAAQKLPAEINERNEKLKEEMLGKLKDLGNLVLRPFGLSTDNFKLQQDPNSGGYSVNFKK